MPICQQKRSLCLCCVCVCCVDHICEFVRAWSSVEPLPENLCECCMLSVCVCVCVRPYVDAFKKKTVGVFVFVVFLCVVGTSFLSLL